MRHRLAVDLVQLLEIIRTAAADDNAVANCLLFQPTPPAHNFVASPELVVAEHFQAGGQAIRRTLGKFHDG